MSFLERHPRLNAVLWRLSRQVLAAEPESAASEEAPSTTEGPGSSFVLEREPPLSMGPGRVTRELLARVPANALEGLEAALTEDEHARWAVASEDERDYFRLPLALVHGVGEVEEKTGLRSVMPPHDIHAMSHAPEATGGSLYYADLIVETLEAVRSPLSPGQAVLDFGCSSGRVVRALQAWQPGVRYLACDPNEPAVAWAADNLPDIEFFPSPLQPPLDVPRESLDVAYAISIWSHFDFEPALAWLREMHRIIRPGGCLLLTTHGYPSIRFYGSIGTVPLERLEGIVADLYRTGFSHYPVFGPEGDWGVPAEGWGMTFLTADWIAEQLTPRWELSLYEAGRVEQNQDLYLLRKTSST